MLKKLLVGVASLMALVSVISGLFVWLQVRAFDASVAKRYEVSVPAVTRSTEPAVLARGKHLAMSLGSCTNCHGSDFGGGKAEQLGPLGTLVYPNITEGKGARGGVYSDGELARLIKHGIKRDGTSVLFMPCEGFAWWPDDDVAAVISYLRSTPPIDGQPGRVVASVMIKTFDRMDLLAFDIARRIDHVHPISAPAPAVTVQYGAYIGRLCAGCHGRSLSGGRLPGAPASMAVPLNLTQHATGLRDWTLDDFRKALREGRRRDGRRLDRMMPIETTKNFTDTELEALWAYLRSLPPVAFGHH